MNYKRAKKRSGNRNMNPGDSPYTSRVQGGQNCNRKIQSYKDLPESQNIRKHISYQVALEVSKGYLTLFLTIMPLRLLLRFWPGLQRSRGVIGLMEISHLE